jgi:hypothetical protein
MCSVQYIPEKDNKKKINVTSFKATVDVFYVTFREHFVTKAYLHF